MGEEPVKYQPDATIFLVACVKTKQPQPMAVKDLYTSEWFWRARAFVELTRCPWYVLSAEYGLLYPDDVVAPYDRTLKQMSAPERRSWGERVQRQLEVLPLEDKTVVLLAGRPYREPVMDYLRSRARDVKVPMENLPQGRQLQWLGEQAEKIRSRTGPRSPDTASRMSTDRAPGASDATAIREALLELGARIDREAMIPTVEPGAARLVLADPYAFLLATCLDRGTRAEIIWTIPTWLQRLWGHLDPHRIRRMDDDAVAEAIANLPKQPRYRTAAVPTIRELTRIVVDEYAGDARTLWNGRPATEFRFTLERIPGVGPGIASMAVQLVDRLFPGELGTGPTAGLDIKPDVHTRRVLYRLGLASEATDRAAHAAARRLMPEYPGRLDGPLWYIGYMWCHAGRPSCDACHMRELCPRRGVDDERTETKSTMAPSSTPENAAQPPTGRHGKYAPLRSYLDGRPAHETHVTLSFRDIETILERPLPRSARDYRPWWANHAGRSVSPQARAWLEAGFHVDSVALDRRSVRFVRTTDKAE